MTQPIFCTDLSGATLRTLDLLSGGFLEKEWDCTNEELVDIFTITDAVHYIDQHYDVFSHMDTKALAQEIARYTMSQIPTMVTRVLGDSSQGMDAPPFTPESSIESSLLNEILSSSGSSLF